MISKPSACVQSDYMKTSKQQIKQVIKCTTTVDMKAMM